MARILRFVVLLASFTLFSQAAAAAVMDYKLTDGDCVSVVVWKATGDANFWRSDAVVVMHPTKDVAYSKDDYTMRHLPIGARIVIHESEPQQVVDAVKTAGTTAVVESEVKSDSTDGQLSARLVRASFLSPSSLPSIAATHSYAAATPNNAHSYEYPQHHIPLEGWLLIIPCLVGLFVCAVHGFNVWRERRELRRHMRRPFPIISADPVLPGEVYDLDLSGLDSLTNPAPARLTPDDFELTFPPLEQGFEVRPPRPPMLN